MQSDRKASYHIGMVSKTNSNTTGGIPSWTNKVYHMHNGNANTTSQLFQKFWIKNDIRKSKSKYQGDIADIMTIQKGRDDRRNGICVLFTSVVEKTVITSYIRIYRIPEKEVGTHNQ